MYVGLFNIMHISVILLGCKINRLCNYALYYIKDLTNKEMKKILPKNKTLHNKKEQKCPGINEVKCLTDQIKTNTKAYKTNI